MSRITTHGLVCDGARDRTHDVWIGRPVPLPALSIASTSTHLSERVEYQSADPGPHGGNAECERESRVEVLGYRHRRRHGHQTEPESWTCKPAL